MIDYQFTSFTTKEVINILLTMERDVCNSLRKCEDIKEGLFKAGTYMGGARSDIYKLLKAEEDKSYDAQLAREAEVRESRTEADEEDK